MTVLQRINEAARILQGSAWTKSMANSAYKSVDIDQIREHVGAAETEAGLIVQYEETAFDTITFNGKQFCRVSAILTYYAVDDAEMEHGVAFPRTGIAQDAGDKGWNKAETMLYKNHYKGLYHIGERSEDPDAFSNEEIEVLEVLRFFAKYNDKRREDYLPHYDNIIQMVHGLLPLMAKMQAEERKAAKKEQMKADPFFSSSGKADDREKDIKVKAINMRPLVEKYVASHPDSPLVVDYTDRHGPVGEWPDSIVVRAWVEDLSKEARE